MAGRTADETAALKAALLAAHSVACWAVDSAASSAAALAHPRVGWSATYSVVPWAVTTEREKGKFP